MEVQNIPPQSQPQEPVIFQPRPKTPIFLVISILMVIVVVGVGAYYLGTKTSKTQTDVIVPTHILTPTTISYPTPTMAILDETANWKTYVNPTYNYSIKYPPFFLLLAPTPGVSEYGLETEIRKSVDEYLFNQLTIEVYPAYDSSSKASEVNKFVSGKLKEISNYDGVVNKPSAEQTKVNNQDATFIRIDFTDGIKKIYFIYNDKRFVELRWTVNLKSENDSTFYQILSTFKFL